MKTKTLSIALAAVVACLISTAQAAVIYYDGTGGNSNLDVSYSQGPGSGGTSETGLLSLGSQSWIDPGGSTAQTRYIGGTVAFTGNNGIFSENINATLHFASSINGNGTVGVYGSNLNVTGRGSGAYWQEETPGNTVLLKNWTITSGVSTADVIFKLPARNSRAMVIRLPMFWFPSSSEPRPTHRPRGLPIILSL